MSRILVVDDTVEARHLLRTILVHAGHDIVEAANGAEALRSLRESPFDLVISDGLMPVMDGFRLCIELRRDPATSTVPFILYTASFTDPDDAQLASTMGADAYLLKPADPSEILAVVNELLNRSEPRKKRPLPKDRLMEAFESYSDRMEQKLDEKVADLSAMRILRDSYHSLLDNLPVHILTLDLDGRPDFTNATARTFAGVDEPAALLDRIHPEDRAKVTAFIESLLADPHPMQTSVMMSGRDGAYRVFEVTGRPYDSPSGDRLGYILAAEDITRREQQKELLLHAAEYDPLTDLPTRHVFDRRFDEILRDVGKGARCALLFIDSDDLRGINDRYGFDVGDATIANIAHTIVDTVRPGDLVARLCATEFVVLAEDLGWKQANELSDAVKEAVAHAPLVPAAPEMRIGVNISINVIPEVDISAPVPAGGERAGSAPDSDSRLRDALQGVPDMLFRPVYSLDDGALTRCSVRYAYSVDDRMISGEELALGAARHGIARRMGTRIIELALVQVHATGIACSVPLSLANMLDAMIFERAELAADSTAIDASKLLFEVPDCDAEGIRPPVSWLSAARRSPIGLVHVCGDLSTLRDDRTQTGASDEIALPVTEVVDAHGEIRPTAAAAIARWRETGIAITVTDIDDRAALDVLRTAGITRVSGDALSPAASSPDQLPRTLPGEE